MESIGNFIKSTFDLVLIGRLDSMSSGNTDYCSSRLSWLLVSSSIYCCFIFVQNNGISSCR